MKHFGFLTLTIILAVTQLQAQSKKSNDEMAFEKTVDGITAHDYGSIAFGSNGKVDFVFKNTSNKPLVISDVKSSCGCTVPNWTKEPVAPGQKGTIEIEYNTKLPGVFNKTVVVYSNAANSPVRLEIRGKVNAQASDLAPGKNNAPNSRPAALEIEGENDKSVPQDSASKAQAAIAAQAKKAAQAEAFKKLMEQPAPPKKTAEAATGTAKQANTTDPKKK